MRYATVPKHYFNQTPLYERNYGKLLNLFRDAPAVAAQVRQSGGLTFRALLLEDHRYTSVVSVSVGMSSGTSAGPDINMTVRMYHDARVAEVVDCAGHGSFEPEYGYPNAHMHQPDEKRQINRLLGEWLDFFARRSSARVSEPQDVL